LNALPARAARFFALGNELFNRKERAMKNGERNQLAPTSQK
jgi:hypothetical protein